jgi:hypothetical protein
LYRPIKQPTLIVLNHTTGRLPNDFLAVVLLASYLYKRSGIKSAVVTGVENLGFGSFKCLFRLAPHYLHIIYGKNRTGKCIHYLHNLKMHVIMFGVSSSKTIHNNPNSKTGPYHIIHATKSPVVLYGFKFSTQDNTINVKRLKCPHISKYVDAIAYKKAIVDIFSKHTNETYQEFR